MAQPCVERMADVPQPGQLVRVLLLVYPRLILPLTGVWLLSYDVVNLSVVGLPDLNIVASGSPILASFNNFRVVHVCFRQ
jgi:hypothetical protein